MRRYTWSGFKFREDLEDAGKNNSELPNELWSSVWWWTRILRKLNSNQSFKQWIWRNFSEHPRSISSNPNLPTEDPNIVMRNVWISKENWDEDLQSVVWSRLHIQRELRWKPVERFAKLPAHPRRSEMNSRRPARRGGELGDDCLGCWQMGDTRSIQTFPRWWFRWLMGSEDSLLKSPKQISSSGSTTLFSLLFLALWFDNLAVESLSSRRTGIHEISWRH